MSLLAPSLNVSVPVALSCIGYGLGRISGKVALCFGVASTIFAAYEKSQEGNVSLLQRGSVTVITAIMLRLSGASSFLVDSSSVLLCIYQYGVSKLFYCPRSTTSSATALSSSSIATSSSLQEMNGRLHAVVIQARPPQLAGGDYRSGVIARVITPEFCSVFQHQHLMFEGVYLGDFRAMLSIDPQFTGRYSMQDTLEEITSSQPGGVVMTQQQYNTMLDHNGCKDFGIDVIISVTGFKPSAAVAENDWANFTPHFPPGVARYEIDMFDDDASWYNLKPHLAKHFKILDQARSEGKKVLIHCVQGKSRSGLFLAAYLMYATGCSLDEADTFMKSKRFQIDIKPGWKKDMISDSQWKETVIKQMA